MSDKHQDSEKLPDQQDQDKANIPNVPTPDQAPKKEMPSQPEGGADKA